MNSIKKNYWQPFRRFWRSEKKLDKQEIIRRLQPLVKAYVNHEAEHGILLPEDFRTDPAAWLETLRKIEYAFDKAVNDQITCKEEKRKIRDGFELFGRYLTELNWS